MRMNMLWLCIRICLSLTKITFKTASNKRGHVIRFHLYKVQKQTKLLCGVRKEVTLGRSDYTGSPEQELLGYGDVWVFVCTYIKIKS